MSFLALLRDDVRAGLTATPQDYRDRHKNWLLARQNSDGAFANRRGVSELYYTTFALRSLSALEMLNNETAFRALKYLSALLHESPGARIRQPRGAFCDAVMAASWWDAVALCVESGAAALTDSETAMAREVTSQRLNALRRDDGGWAKTDADACGSLYHTFLAACAYMRMGIDLPQPGRARELLRGLTLPGGGFLENRYSKKPGTNGCAAAIALSVILEDPVDPEPHAAFIASMFSAEGGFYATSAAPIADLLSTYTGLFTLKMLGKLEARFLDGALRYARGLEHADDGGGYAGFALEQICDCEYTFYGLGVESIVATAKA